MHYTKYVVTDDFSIDYNCYNTNANVKKYADEITSLECEQGSRSLLSIEEDNLQFYPNFALFSTLGG